MADLKFGNVTPAVGNIKLGSNNVSEIYQGATKLWPQSAPPSPGEVTVCDLVWTRENSIITATTTGGNIPIVTNQTDWTDAISNQQAAACYWDFDPNNAFRGLLYNIYATEVIQPPAGFRVPTEQDFTDLRFCVSAGSPQGIQDVTSLGNNYYGFWTSTLPSNPRFGTVDFNAIGSGYTYRYGTGNQVFGQQGQRDIYWIEQTDPITSSNQPFRAFLTYDAFPYGSGSNVRYLQGYNGGAYSLTYRHGFAMRFVKDAPPPVEFYDNDNQTGTPTTFLELIRGTSGFGTGFADQRDIGSVVISGSPATLYLYQYADVTGKGHFGATNTPTQPGGRVSFYTAPNRNVPSYEILWTSGNQGGTWSPTPTYSDRKEEAIIVPAGTWYIQLQVYGQVTTQGSTVNWYTGVRS